jgi:hypothetical protein
MVPQTSDPFSALNRSSASRGSFLALSLAGLVTVGIQFYLWPHITDDAYISFRYAYHLASGEGLVFNPGERVEGFSNPLWTVLLGALLALTKIPVPDLARGIGLICALGTLVIIYFIYKRHLASLGIIPFCLSLVFLLATPGFHVYATAGLEGPLLSFLIVSGLFLSLAPTRPGILAALLFGFVGITRPEGPLYAFLWFLATVQTEKTRGELVRKELPRFFVMLLPIIGWQIFRLMYYGEWIPNTAVAKVSGVFGEFINLPDYIAPWIIAIGGPLVILLWIFLPPSDPAVRRLERISLAILGGTVVFVAYARGDWMNFGRFIVPTWPLLAMVFPLWLHTGWERLASAAELRFRKGIGTMPFLAVLLGAFLAWRPSVEDYIGNKEMNMLMRGTDQIAVGTWIKENIAAGATIATGRLGGIGYGAMHNIVWDWFGLTDAEEARFIRKGRPGTIDDDPVFRRKPDVIAAIEAPADWSYKRAVQLMNYLQDDYRFIMGFPQGTYGYVDIWIRKDRLDEVFLTRERFVLPSQEKEEQ